MKRTAFGKYIRDLRVLAELTQVEVAKVLGIVPSYLGEVERGIRGPLKQKYWPKLVEAIPGVTLEQLGATALRSAPLSISMADKPVEYQVLALALKKRMEQLDLSDGELRELLEIFGDDIN